MAAIRLAPSVRNALMGRWVVYEALDALKPQLVAQGCTALVRAVESEVEGRTRYALEAVDRTPLPDFLDGLAGGLRDAVGYASAADRQRLVELFDTIDARVVVLTAEPADPLQRLCESLLDTAVAAYRQLLPQPPPRLQDSTEFTMIYVVNRPELSFAPFAGSAVTHAQAGHPDLSRVELRLSVGEFDLLSFNSLPYAIFHECVCHVLQGPWDDSRTLPDPASRYAEGWMDYAALTLYRLLLRGGLPLVDLPEDDFPELRRPGFEEAAGALHQARVRELPQDRAWGHRSMGAWAAHALLHRLARMPGPGPGADVELAFLELSFAINASAMRQQEREEFTQLMHSGLLRAERLAALWPLLAEYYRHRDVPHLLSGLRALQARWTAPPPVAADARKPSSKVFSFQL
ncbi:hypothetical protein AB0M28_13865 [Streptomyces sp. NPDC051940]|uniref:hypothetical protein n=1 Tax=Streptomyces sp. NPDC051940 TaxID=3155675 RepID=UPI0034258D0C